MKYILLFLCCVVSSCGTFGGSYTDEKGVKYNASVTVPKNTTSDAK
jgi:hypothetical protein